jgi:hypothetical protein
LFVNPHNTPERFINFMEMFYLFWVIAVWEKKPVTIFKLWLFDFARSKTGYAYTTTIEGHGFTLERRRSWFEVSICFYEWN